MAKFCRNCGNPLKEGTKFCVSCGTPVAGEPAPGQAQPGNSGSNNAQPVKPRMNAATQGNSRVTAAQQGKGQAKTQPQNVRTPQKNKPAKQFNVKVFIVSAVVIFVAVILVCCGAVIFSGSGDSDASGGGGSAEINEVDVLIPYPKGQEAVVNATATLAIKYDMAAQAYLDQFIQYDLENGSIEEYSEILDNALAAYENLENISECLEKDVDIWMATDDEDSRKAPEIVAWNKEYPEDGSNPFVTRVYAAKRESASMKWAKEITKTFDKAKAGTGIRTLAQLLNTDAKHAYAQLKQAQEIIKSGAEMEEADLYNKCYQIARTTKAGAAVAGVIVSTGGLAGSSITLTVPGVLEGVVTLGGTIISGYTSCLELGSAGGIIAHNGEENSLSAKYDQMQKDVEGISTFFTIAGGIYNVKNLCEGFVEDASLVEKVVNEDSLGLVQTGFDNYMSYTEDGEILGIKVTKEDEGIKMVMMDTTVGDSKAAQDAVKVVLENAGVDKETADAVVKKGVENRQGKSEETPVEVSDTIPVDKIPNVIGNLDTKTMEEDKEDLKVLEKEIDKTMDELGIEPGSGDIAEEEDGYGDSGLEESYEDADASEEYGGDYGNEEDYGDIGNSEEGEEGYQEEDTDGEYDEEIPVTDKADEDLMSALAGTYYLTGTGTGHADGREIKTNSISASMELTPSGGNTFKTQIIYSSSDLVETGTAVLDKESMTASVSVKSPKNKESSKGTIKFTKSGSSVAANINMSRTHIVEGYTIEGGTRGRVTMPDTVIPDTTLVIITKLSGDKE